MQLSAATIRKEIAGGGLVFSPQLTEDHFQPAGVQLRLGKKILVPRKGQRIDFRDQNLKIEYDEVMMTSTGYSLGPFEFVLGQTLEGVTVPLHLACQVDGRSTLARVGTSPHQAAMQIWPGHGSEGARPITLEFFNCSPFEVVLFEGMWCTNLIFYQLTSPAEAPYDLTGRYGTDTGPALARTNG